MEIKRDWLDWVWGYEKLGEWFLMRIFLALVFLVIAAVTLHFVFHTYWKLVASGKAGALLKQAVGFLTG